MSQPSRSACLYSHTSPTPCWGYRHRKPCLTLYKGAKDLNSGSYISEQTLLSRLSPSADQSTAEESHRPFRIMLRPTLKVLQRLTAGLRIKSCHRLSSLTATFPVIILASCWASHSWPQRPPSVLRQASSCRSLPLSQHKLHIPLHLDFSVLLRRAGDPAQSPRRNPTAPLQ